MPFVEKLVIHGGHPLRGDVQVRGGKNTSLAVLSAALLCDEPVTLENLPDIEDVHVLLELMRRLGARIQRSGRNATIDPRQLTSHRPAPELCRKLRGSYYLLGALLGRVGEGAIPYPGGCEIGAGPSTSTSKASGRWVRRWTTATAWSKRAPRAWWARRCSWTASPWEAPSTSCWPPRARRATP